MPRSSHGSRRTANWAIAQKPRPMPRVVRLGRAANDNARSSGARTRVALFVGVAIALAAIALAAWPPV